jgi:ubiquitin C-terminal hydrolase
VFVAPSEPQPAESTAASTTAADLGPVDATTAERFVRDLDQRRAHLPNGTYPKDSLLGALATFTAPEVLADAYNCDHCDELRRAVRQACILRAPETLTLCLKRFRTVIAGKSLEMVKFGGHVTVPTHLDLAPFAAAESSDAALTYTLYGVVSHSGGNTRSGHYIALTRTEQGWTYFSDTVAKTSTESDAVAAQAYLLFYRRQAAPEQSDQ